MIDASVIVARVLAPYGNAIGAILRDVTGDPAAVRQAESSFRAGAATSVQVSTNVTAMSGRLGQSWNGAANDSYAGASRGLADRLDQVRVTLARQADGMAAVAEAQARTERGVEQVLRGFNEAARNLLSVSRSVPPEWVQPLVTQAARVGGTCYTAAAGQKTAFGQVLSAVAGQLRQAKPAAKPTLTDRATMYAWIYDCIKQREVGTKLSESALRTVAGVPASMATPNQTIMSNAVDTLRNPYGRQLWGLVTPPLEARELTAAKGRMDTIASAWNPTSEAFKAEKKQADALAAVNRWKAELASAQHAADAARIHKAQGMVADLQRVYDERAAATERATARAQALLADPDKYVRDHLAGTGLTANDLKNMLLAGMRARTSVTEVERRQMQSIEDGLRAAGDLRVTTDGRNNPAKTLYKFPGEDLAAWQRKGVNELDVGNGKVGARINDLATHDPGHRTLTDAFLNAVLDDARRRYPNNENLVVRKVASANNSGKDYWPAILACYQGKRKKT